MTEASASDCRVLFLASTARDAVTTDALLAKSDIRLQVCRTFDDLLKAMQQGCAAILLPEESIPPCRLEELAERLANQAPWSDLPVLILTRQGADSDSLVKTVRRLGNVTLIERPVRIATFVSAVQTALRARE